MRMFRRVLVLSAPLLLGACSWVGGWFDRSPAPVNGPGARPGVDRQAAPSGLPPAPQRGTYDNGAAAPVNETRGQQLGAVVAPKGGQKAQVQQAEKERLQREAERYKEREQERRQTAQPPAATPATETKSNTN